MTTFYHPDRSSLPGALYKFGRDYHLVIGHVGFEEGADEGDRAIATVRISNDSQSGRTFWPYVRVHYRLWTEELGKKAIQLPITVYTGWRAAYFEPHRLTKALIREGCPFSPAESGEHHLIIGFDRLNIYTVRLRDSRPWFLTRVNEFPREEFEHLMND